MKCYTLATPGIRCVSGVISVGESGRGRKLVSVPLPPAAVMEADQRPGGSDSLLVECRGPATSALVLIPDQSGFRGGWSLRGARSAEDWDGIISGDCPRQSMFATPAIDAARLAWVAAHPEPKVPGTVIAEGFSAQGNAGAMGGGPEYLLVLDHGQAVEIVRRGRLYGKPSCLRLACVAGRIEMTDPRAAAEERAAGAKWEAIATETGAEPVEVTLGWGGGGTARRHAEAMDLRPILVDAAGTVHVFQGVSIPGVVDVIEDVSLRSGYVRSRHESYRCFLHAGVAYRGDEQPEAATAEPERQCGTSLGGLLAAAGWK